MNDLVIALLPPEPHATHRERSAPRAICRANPVHSQTRWHHSPENLGLFVRRAFGYGLLPAAMQTPVNAFSVDVEDWYQVADFDAVVPFDNWDQYESRVRRNTDKILAMLDEAGVKGTSFVLTWNPERCPNTVRDIHKAGHEVASHGYAHRIVYEQTPEQFGADVERAKKILEDIINTWQPTSVIVVLKKCMLRQKKQVQPGVK